MRSRARARRAIDLHSQVYPVFARSVDISTLRTLRAASMACAQATRSQDFIGDESLGSRGYAGDAESNACR
jgi:hypothetical protein